MPDYLGTEKQKTPYERYLEALRMSGQTTDIPMDRPFMTNTFTNRISTPPPLVYPPVPPILPSRPGMPTPPVIQPPMAPSIPRLPAVPASVPPESGGRNLLTTIGKGLKAGIGELSRGLKLGSEGYRSFNLYKEMLPYQREEYNRQLKLKQATPDYEVDKIKADATKAYLAGTATEQQKTLLGVIPKQKADEADKIEKGALLHFTNTKKWGSNKGGFDKAKAQFQLLEAGMKEKGIDTAKLWADISNYWQEQVGTGFLGTGIWPRTYK